MIEKSTNDDNSNSFEESNTDNFLDNISMNDTIADESKDNGSDSSKNLFSRLFSTFRKNGQDVESTCVNSIQQNPAYP